MQQGVEVMEVSGKLEAVMDLARMATEPLDPALVPYVEERGQWGPMLRHPLVYQVPLLNNGLANQMLRQKQGLIHRAERERNWNAVVFFYERAYRLQAFIDYVVGRDDDDLPFSLHHVSEADRDLACDVWVDSENIQQNIEEWRRLFANGDDLWLGTVQERMQFNGLPDPIPAYRGGAVGDWSWTTSKATAQFFSRQSGYPVREALIPKADVFGYLTRRGEYELLVKMTPERERLVYPDGEPEC